MGEQAGQSARMTPDCPSTIGQINLRPNRAFYRRDTPNHSYVKPPRP
jgi:hypothetical protein